MPIPTTEARVKITRGTAVTWISTVTPWAFMIPKIAPLLDVEDVVLVNRVVEGSGEAEVPYPPAPAGSRRPVQVLVAGDHTPDGTPVTGWASQLDQLDANIAYLANSVVKRVATGTGTVDVELFGLTGATKGVKPAQFVGPMRTLDDTPITAIITLDFWFPKGVFTL